MISNFAIYKKLTEYVFDKAYMFSQ